jgi:hypothetical protein
MSPDQTIPNQVIMDYLILEKELWYSSSSKLFQGGHSAHKVITINGNVRMKVLELCREQGMRGCRQSIICHCKDFSDKITAAVILDQVKLRALTCYNKGAFIVQETDPRYLRDSPYH